MSWPMLVAQLASIAMMLVDTWVVGHYSTTELAAVAIGSSLYISLMLGLSGIVQAVGPVVAHDFGAGRYAAIGPAIGQGIWLALGLALPGELLLLHPGPVLDLVAVTPDVAGPTIRYLRVLAWCLPVSLMFRVFHAAANALGQPRSLMLIAIGQTLGHAFLASLLVPGLGEIPGLGAVGAALSQAIMSWGACLAGFVMLRWGRTWKPYQCLRRAGRPEWHQLSVYLKLGLPMGVSYLVEITAFTFVALFVARLGAEVVGAHRIVTNLSAAVYMLPLAIATATSALVAQSAGAGREREAALMACSGMGLSAVLAMVIGLLIWLTRQTLVAFGTSEEGVASLAVSLLFYVAVYQLPDGIQTVAGFALRGYKVTLLPLLIHVFSFWGLGLGFGYWLAFLAPTPQGVAGFWQSSVLSTVAACLLLGGLLNWVIRTRSKATSER